MSLRDMVTGSDACTTTEGAGPSNAFAGLANRMLGTSSKQQERLKEIPGFHGLPGSLEARFEPQRPEEAASAAANGPPLQIPGIYNDHGFHGMDSAGTAQFPAPLNWHDEFADMQAGSFQRPTGRITGIAPFLQAFLGSASGHPQIQPFMNQKLHLSVKDQCQIRDRSTIIARHIFTEGGDQAADEQVFRLLESIHIDPRALPNEATKAGWDEVFANGRTYSQQKSLGRDLVQQSEGRFAANSFTAPEDIPISRWADQFGALNLHQGMADDPLVNEFLTQQGGEWANEYLTEPKNDWSEEISQAQHAATGDLGQAKGTADALEQTKALRDTLASSQDPKIRQSKFLQFVSKMSRGEIVLADNQAKVAPGAVVGNQWAEEHEQDSRNKTHEQVWDQYNQQADGGRSTWAKEFEEEGGGPAGWADQFHRESHPPHAWADQFAAESSAEGWAEDFAAGQAQEFSEGLGAGDQGYAMASDNPFVSDLNSFAKGTELFRNGLLSEARLALEAEVQRQPGNVEAWRLLGTVHAENDNDQQAIAALKKALSASPGNAEVLLSLGVSYTNELDQRRAITYLLEWLKLQPYQREAASVQLPNNSREKLRVVLDIFRSAAQMNRESEDAHIALGVLYNLSRDYNGAVDAFRQALSARPSDYSLWNKLGATLANSGRSSEAIDAYQKALELKPNYMRAWVNMGISQANIGEYEASIRFYGRALTLNPQAAPVWSYLRTSVTCAGLDNLLQAVDDEDLDAITSAMPL